MFNTDVASGKIHTNTGCSSGYSTTGPANVNHILNNLKKQPVSECYVWDIAETCSPTQTELLRDGKAIVKDFIMVGYNAANGTAIHY
jgi:carboxypeptidase D